MKSEWEDYYKILQVHFMADSEAIRSAYLRLSKKYHPDNNTHDSQEKMKKVNKAYEILSSPETRNKYTMRWVDKYSPSEEIFKNQAATYFINKSIEPVQNILLTYLRYIQNNQYEAAYELLSKQDRKKISSQDFVRWQTLVAETFELISYECDFHSMFKDIKVNNSYFETCIRMRVQVVEKNHLMDRIESDQFYKNIVCEDDIWHIYLGHQNLKAIIEKFYGLAKLKKKKVENIDRLNPMQANKNTFFEKAQREQERYNRYGNVFTLIRCEAKEQYMKEMDKCLNRVLRKLDIAYRWDNNTYLILLPETNEKSAQYVINKITHFFEQKDKRSRDFSLDFKIIQQQDDNLEALIEAATQLSN